MPTALLVIDVQNAVLDGCSRPDRQVQINQAQDAMVARLRGVLARARAAAIPVVFVQHTEPGTRMAEGSIGWQFRPEIAPVAGEVIVRKATADSFHATDLQQQLAATGTTHIVIGGNATPYCIDTTARRAVSLGYDVTLLADGHMCGDIGDLSFEAVVAHHNAILDGFDAGRHLISVVPSERVSFP
jgi:nicotinamidase-related amidase